MVSILLSSVAESHRCVKFKAKSEYPQLVFWAGPGNGFKLLGSPTIDNLNNFFEIRNKNPLKPLKEFIEGISLVTFK